jgi:hypothetical protein
VIETARHSFHDRVTASPHLHAIAQDPIMFTLITDHLSRLTRLLPQAAQEVRYEAVEQRQSGWHESSWVLAQGVEVIELPASVSVALFPDTVPAAYYDNTGEDARRAA